MKYIFIFVLLLSISIYAAPEAPSASSSGGSGNAEFALGGSYYLPSKTNNNTLEPEPGYSIRLQNGSGEANYFNMVSNLEFSITGMGNDSFTDADGNTLSNVPYDYYTINYHLGFRFNLSPGSFILPYFGTSGVLSIATFQFYEQTSDNFPENQRGLMYGGTLFTGIDIYLSGNKDSGWGFRIEGDVVRLFPYSKFVMGTPEIFAYNMTAMLLFTY